MNETDTAQGRAERDRFLSMAELLYEAALQRTGWETALERIARACGARGVMLMGIQAQTLRVTFQVVQGMDPAEFTGRALRLATGDPHGYADLRFAFDCVRPGGAEAGVEEIVRWLEGRRGQSCYVGARMFVAAGEPAIAVLECGEDMDAAGFERFSRIAPHIQRALQISHRLAALDLHSTAVGDTIEMLPFGIFLIDLEQKVRFANQAARDILAEHDGFELRHDELHALEPDADTKLRRLIRLASARHAYPGNDAPGGGMLLERPSGKRSYSILVSPLHQEEQVLFASESAAAAAFVTDPERREPLPHDFLRGVYGLTNAEARLACLLTRGFTLDEAAEELGTARGTVRVHLERIFRKTGTNRQPDLLRLLLTSPALVKPPEA